MFSVSIFVNKQVQLNVTTKTCISKKNLDKHSLSTEIVKINVYIQYQCNKYANKGAVKMSFKQHMRTERVFCNNRSLPTFDYVILSFLIRMSKVVIRKVNQPHFSNCFYRTIYRRTRKWNSSTPLGNSTNLGRTVQRF